MTQLASISSTRTQQDLREDEMAFPDLSSVSPLRAEATGTPTNGQNTFAIGISASDVDEDHLHIDVFALGPSIRNAEYVSLSGDKSSIVVSFRQTGSDQAKVIARVNHSLAR
jgi:hypothetical protein